MEVEITVWSVNAYTQPGEAQPIGAIDATHPTETAGQRPLFDPGLGSQVTATVVNRSDIRPGQIAQGPAIVVEDETSVVVPSSREVLSHLDGTLDVRLKTNKDRSASMPQTTEETTHA